MKISSNGINFIKNEECKKDAEGKIICPLQAYPATPQEEKEGIYTIGYGNTFYSDGKKVKKSDKITQQQADELFANTIHEFESKLQPMLTMPLTQNQYDAIVSLVYNIGLSAFVNSTILKDLHAGNYNKAAMDFTSWIYQHGKVLHGLVDRRNRERALFYEDHPQYSQED